VKTENLPGWETLSASDQDEIRKAAAFIKRSAEVGQHEAYADTFGETVFHDAEAERDAMKGAGR
jgi:hypothetical protein